MALGIQLEMFSPKDDFSLLLNEINTVRTENSNTRRGIFSRFDALKKEFELKFTQQRDEIELLKKQLEIKED